MPPPPHKKGPVNPPSPKTPLQKTPLKNFGGLKFEIEISVFVVWGRVIFDPFGPKKTYSFSSRGFIAGGIERGSPFAC